MFVPGGPLTLLGIEYLVEPPGPSHAPASPRGWFGQWLTSLLGVRCLAVVVPAQGGDRPRG